MITNRSTEKEIMDSAPEQQNIHQYNDCLDKLFRVNQLLGFFKETVRTLKQFPSATSLLDVGCGGGLFLLHLTTFFPTMRMRGIDISPDAIRYANYLLQKWQKNEPAVNVTYDLQAQPQLNMASDSIDIILTTLVCHHMSDIELINFLQASYKTARQGIIINDLHRHWLAQIFYMLLSPLLFRNKMISHDGLISIRRGFKRKEIVLLLRIANIKNYKIKWCFPFRWKIVIRK